LQGVNNEQIIKQMQVTEDIYTNTINELQQDRMRLKGKEMMTRLNELHKDHGAFDQLTQMFKSDWEN